MNGENNKQENTIEIESAEEKDPSVSNNEINPEASQPKTADLQEGYDEISANKRDNEPAEDITAEREEINPVTDESPSNEEIKDSTVSNTEETETVTEEKSEKQPKQPKKDKPNPIISFLFETLEMVAISVGIVILLITFVVRYSPVSGESMTYTIDEGDSLLVQIAFYTPQKNDIVILQAPDYDLNKPLIKRVIATGGDSIEINFNTWQVKVNGTILDEAYVRHNPFEYNPDGDAIPDDFPMSHQDIYDIPEGTFDAETNTFKASVPEGTIFVMGDNRNNSHDSRSSNVGFVDERCVIGKAIYRLYPFSKVGKLD